MLTFATPIWLFGLLALPLLAMWHWQGVIAERQALDDFSRDSVRRKMGVRAPADWRLVRGGLVLATIATSLVALAQPRWGAEERDGLESRPGSLVVVLDVSKSMLARDAGGESRLDVARDLVEKLLPSLAGWRVGVVAFAGEAQAVVPLTTDHAAVATMFGRARPGLVAGGGSNLEAGLKAATGLFRQGGRRVALVLSDGEELGGNAAPYAAQLQGARIAVHSFGMGSPDGAMIPGDTDVWGNPSYLTYRGEKVTSRLDEATLRRLADMTQGSYVRLADANAAAASSALERRLGLNAAQAATPIPGPTRETSGGELAAFQVPLALAFLLYAIDTGWAIAWRLRRGKAPRITFRSFPDHVREWLGRSAVATAWVALVLTQSAWTWYPSWWPNGEAARAYQAGDLSTAQQRLDTALAHDPDNFRLRYNLGNVQYDRKEFAPAAQTFAKALAGADAETRPVIGYNLGNALFRMAEAESEPPKQVGGYTAAVKAYEAVVAARPQDKDAKENLEVARARLAKAKKAASQGGASPTSGGANGGQNSGQTPVGVRSHYEPAPMRNLPSTREVDTLLRALETDEKQRQADAGGQPQAGDNGTGPDAQQLLRQALGNMSQDKDW